MTARWTTPLPSRFLFGGATIGLPRCLLDSSGTHPNTAPRGPKRFESCPLKCTLVYPAYPTFLGCGPDCLSLLPSSHPRPIPAYPATLSAPEFGQGITAVRRSFHESGSPALWPLRRGRRRRRGGTGGGGVGGMLKRASDRRSARLSDAAVPPHAAKHTQNGANGMRRHVRAMWGRVESCAASGGNGRWRSLSAPGTTPRGKAQRG